MDAKVLIKIFNRDLNKLKDELNAYGIESNLWLIPDGIKNSAGNLGLHLVGNLNHFIGAILGNTGYVRERDLEFSQKNIPREIIIGKIDETIEIVEDTLKKLESSDLTKPYPLEVFKKPMTAEYFLVHLASHLAYHLGQINYHRRLLNL